MKLHRLISLKQQQQGVTLLISLIMLIAMTLAGIAMFRQIGTGVIIARNLTFKQAALAASDIGVEDARNWVVNTSNETERENAVKAWGYYPAWCNTILDANNKPDADYNGVVDNCLVEPQPAVFAVTASGYNWTDSRLATADDGNGNEVRYVIHRMCSTPGSLSVANQQCVTIGSASNGGSKSASSYGQHALPNTVQPYYRITTRVRGPMNTVVYSQTVFH